MRKTTNCYTCCKVVTYQCNRTFQYWREFQVKVTLLHTIYKNIKNLLLLYIIYLTGETIQEYGKSCNNVTSNENQLVRFKIGCNNAVTIVTLHGLLHDRNNSL